MNFLQAVLLGLVQGLAEFLPISSSGHLALLELIFGSSLANADDNALFNILLHLATLVAVIIAYRSDIADILRECLHILRSMGRGSKLDEEGRPTRRLILMIIISTLPLLVVLPIHNLLEELNAYPWFIGAALIVTGCLLFLADRFPKGTKTNKNMTVADALIIGAAQAVATMPGLSRSGTTITAGVSRGLKRDFAVKFSFLMSLISVVGAVLLEAVDVVKDGVGDASLIPMYLVGMVIAGITGYFSIILLQKIVNKGRFGGFCWYCWAVGLLTVILSIVL